MINFCNFYYVNLKDISSFATRSNPSSIFTNVSEKLVKIKVMVFFCVKKYHETIVFFLNKINFIVY